MEGREKGGLSRLLDRISQALVSGSGKKVIATRVFSALAGFTLVLFLNIRCHALSDDFHFIYVWQDFEPCGNDRLMSGFGDLVESVRNYYIMSGGRALCHFLCFFMLMFPPVVFDIVNSIVFVCFAELLLSVILQRYRLITGSGDAPPVLYPLTYLLLFFLIPNFGDNVLWLCGSINYLWSSVLLLIAVKAADRFFEDPRLVSALWVSVPLFISSLTNEVTGGMIGIYCFFSFLYHISRNEKKAPLFWIALPMCFVVTGMAIVVLSPGNSVRVEVVEKPYQTTIDTGLSPTPEKLELVASYLKQWFEHYGILNIVLIGSAAALISDRKTSPVGILYEYRYTIAGFAGIAVLGLSGVYYERATMLGVTLILADHAAGLFRLAVHLRAQPNGKALYELVQLAVFGGFLLIAVNNPDPFLLVGLLFAETVIFAVLWFAAPELLPFRRKNVSSDSGEAAPPAKRRLSDILMNALRRSIPIASAAAIFLLTAALIPRFSLCLDNFNAYDTAIERAERQISEGTFDFVPSPVEKIDREPDYSRGKSDLFPKESAYWTFTMFLKKKSWISYTYGPK